MSHQDQNIKFQPINHKEIPGVFTQKFSDADEGQQFFFWKESEEFFRNNFPINEFCHISFDKAKFLIDSKNGEFIAIFKNLDENKPAFLDRFAFRAQIK